jgi:hypothetical protein
MRKCPDCAEEITDENLFCEYCGRCLLAPDPELGRQSTAMHTEYSETTEVIDFDDGNTAKKLPTISLKGRYQTERSAIVGWLIFLNLLIFTLMAQIAMYIVSR